ncbi:DUF262 domain-containing protein [Desertibacillus haloalkaliphilus]|uniref:DUF262 domain-containing protein n=1 Tax=Desertibacillus haloalkaliphilus TaxID=1328930 RepID=UPI001C25670B|nr:DUF262 domain-containing protein [Desertibacillus haloalkaliphilus]MBU8907677.1 DUF262 domain-containing protein [Desertibacillus haloalkaliphilus]
MATEVKQYNVSDIVASIQEDDPNKRKIKITVPKMQRNLVWSREQKHKFIDTLKRGYPFGSLLLYKKNNDDTFSLIDGLQRTSTIIQYSKEPTSFFNADDIDDSFIDYFIQTVHELSGEHSEKIRDIIEMWVKSLDGFDEGHNFSAYDLVRKISKDLELNITVDVFDELVDKYKEFTSKVKREADISQIQIPVVVYYGEEHNLPEIFERINSKGTKLNKYQIFAATWERTLPINNKEIIKKIEAKYELMLEEGFEIEGYYPEELYEKGKEFTIFEYLFGFGKFLSEEYPHLFGKSGKADTTESIGFNLVTTCCGLPLNKMIELPKTIESYYVSKLEKAILDTIEFVHNSLSALSFKANRKNKKDKGDKIYHTELQIVSIIGVVFHLKYDKNLNVRNTWNTNKFTLKKYIPLHYLYDILRDIWRGSGDSRLKDIVFDEDLQTRGRYLQPISKSKWENLLQEWFETQLNRTEIQRVKIYDQDMLFIKYIYNSILTNEENYDEFEVDHLFAINRLKKVAQDLNGIPISAVSNLAMIKKPINRAKGEKTLKEYFDYSVDKGKVTPTEANEEMNKLKKLIFCDISQVDINKDSEGNDNITKEWYIDKLRTRFKLMKQVFFEKVYRD